MVLRQETHYPETESTTLSLQMERPLRFAVRIRVPGWSTGMFAHINSVPVSLSAEPGRWAAIEREWSPGDQVTIRIPMTLRLVPVDRWHPNRVAILFGPVVLAQDEACCRRPFALEAGAEPAKRLIREDPELRFWIVDTMPERHRRFLQPLYAFPGFWPYWVYFDLDAPPLY